MTSELEKIKSLRKMIPVGMLDAKHFLNLSKGNLEKARSFFIEEEIEKLFLQTGESKEIIGKLFFEEDYDIIRTLDAINDYIFNREFNLANYETRKHDLNMLDAWLITIQSFGFLNSLQTADFSSITLVIKEIGYHKFSLELHEAHLYLAQKEKDFMDLSEEKLIQAVDELKADEKYQSILEAYKMKVLLNPDFHKVLARMQRNILE